MATRKKKPADPVEEIDAAEAASKDWELKQLKVFRAIMAVYGPPVAYGSPQLITAVGSFYDKVGWFGIPGWEYDGKRLTEYWRKLLRRQVQINMTDAEKEEVIRLARMTGKFLE